MTEVYSSVQEGDYGIKREKCPRLVILSINSTFHKKHKPDAGIVYLDKEQSGENETFMDMLLEVEGCKYHFEFQLLEGNMAMRMYANIG